MLCESGRLHACTWVVEDGQEVLAIQSGRYRQAAHFDQRGKQIKQLNQRIRLRTGRWQLGRRNDHNTLRRGVCRGGVAEAGGAVAALITENVQTTRQQSRLSQRNGIVFIPLQLAEYIRYSGSKRGQELYRIKGYKRNGFIRRVPDPFLDMLLTRFLRSGGILPPRFRVLRNNLAAGCHHYFKSTDPLLGGGIPFYDPTKERSMTRIIIAGVLGAIVYYIWGWIAWMAIPLHTPTMAGLVDDAAVTAVLKNQNLKTGVYQYPWPDNGENWQDPESDFAKKHQAGPLYSIYYQQTGAAPMNARVMAGGFVIALLAAMLAACLLSSVSIDAGGSYARRVGFVIGLGIFVALVGHASYWNWMHFPTDYTIAFIIDVLIGWTLAGLVIAGIVRPQEAGRTAVAERPTAQPQAKAIPKKSKPAAAPPGRNDAITLLATLQREARFVDIVKEPLADYSDAQVGAAARDVLRDCGAVLDRLFNVQPIVDKEEGSEVDLPAGFDTGRYRVTGNVTGEAPYSGPLVHHGWEAKRCALPQWSGSKDAALVVTPAELEVK